MSVIEVATLASGSTGNMTYIRVNDTRIAVDAGISCKAIKNALEGIGTSPSELDAIFVTHEHSDHIKGLPVLTKKYPVSVHAAGMTAEYVCCADGCLCAHPPVYEVRVGCVTVRSFITPHDSLCSVGYIITPDGDEESSIGVATDMGFVPGEIEEQLRACRYVVLESNHDPELLRTGPYPDHLKYRIASRTGHLSNADCAQCVVRLATGGVKGIILAHLSEENNRPELALIESKTALERAGIDGVTLKVAAKNDVIRLV